MREIKKITEGWTEETSSRYCAVTIRGDKVNVGFDIYDDETGRVDEVVEYECENDEELILTFIYTEMTGGCDYWDDDDDADNDDFDDKEFEKVMKWKEEGKIKRLY